MPFRKALIHSTVGAIVVSLTSIFCAGQAITSHRSAILPSSHSPDAISGYNLPPKDILDVMRAPSPPVPVVSPTEESDSSCFLAGLPVNFPRGDTFPAAGRRTR